MTLEGRREILKDRNRAEKEQKQVTNHQRRAGGGKGKGWVGDKERATWPHKLSPNPGHAEGATGC